MLALLQQQGSQNVTDLRVVGEGGRTWTRMKPMLCRYWMYCCRKALHISCSQGSSFTLQGSASVESQLWLRSLPEAVESFERWRFWKRKSFPKETCHIWPQQVTLAGTPPAALDEQRTDLPLPESTNSCFPKHCPTACAETQDPRFTQAATDYRKRCPGRRGKFTSLPTERLLQNVSGLQLVHTKLRASAPTAMVRVQSPCESC